MPPSKKHRITVGIPGPLWGPLLEAAEREGLSPAAWIVRVVRAALAAEARSKASVVVALEEIASPRGSHGACHGELAACPYFNPYA